MRRKSDDDEALKSARQSYAEAGIRDATALASVT
jgi:hypothetical protein